MVNGCRLVTIMRSRMGVVVDNSFSIRFGTVLRGALFDIAYSLLLLLLWGGSFGDDFEYRRLFRGSSIQC